MKIYECNETLVLVQENDRLRLSPISEEKMQLRSGVYQRLQKASFFLPESYTLILIEAYRSQERQKHLWEKQFNVVKKDNPSATLSELERINRYFVAKPSDIGGGHQTGAAVDVTLGDQYGKQLTMGTLVQEFNNKTATYAKTITNDVSILRKILASAMEKAGFRNYPGEWWHFSYGDQLWAAYSRKNIAIYGSISNLEGRTCL